MAKAMLEGTSRKEKVGTRSCFQSLSLYGLCRLGDGVNQRPLEKIFPSVIVSVLFMGRP